MSGGVVGTASNSRLVRLVVLIALVIALVTGCQADATVVIDVSPDGSGAVTVTLTLDEPATRAVGDLSEVVALDDMRKAGWQVEGPIELGDGGTKLSVTRPFENVAQANAILDGLSGPDGPLQDFELGRTSQFASTEITAQGELDLSRGLAAFGDAELTESLDGATVADVVAYFNGDLPLTNEQLTMSVRVVPAGMSVAGTNVDGVSSSLGDAPTRIDMVAKKRHTGTLLLAGAAVVLLVGAVWLAFFDVMPGTRKTRAARRHRKQRHSARNSWRYVEQRTGTTAPPKKVSKSRRGRHARPRGK